MNHNNIYSILDKLDALTPKAKPEPQPQQKIYESVESKGSVLEGVAAVEARLAEKYMGFKKTVGALKKQGGIENPEALAAKIGRDKYGKKAFQKAAASGKKMGEAAPQGMQQAGHAAGEILGAGIGFALGAFPGALIGGLALGPGGAIGGGLGTGLPAAMAGTTIGGGLGRQATNFTHDALVNAWRKVSAKLGGPEATANFVKAHAQAADYGKANFEFDGKKYAVTMDRAQARKAMNDLANMTGVNEEKLCAECGMKEGTCQHTRMQEDQIDEREFDNRDDFDDRAKEGDTYKKGNMTIKKTKDGVSVSHKSDYDPSAGDEDDSKPKGRGRPRIHAKKEKVDGRGRGRPKKEVEPFTSKASQEQGKKLQDIMIGKHPKKPVKGTVVKGKAMSHDVNKKADESAPPGAKAERMVRHIKAGYAKDGNLTDVEKRKAYGAAWKAHNRGAVEENMSRLERTLTEGINFRRMAEEAHMTMSEMLECMQGDIQMFQETGECSERLRDFMEVYSHGKKKLEDSMQTLDIVAPPIMGETEFGIAESQELEELAKLAGITVDEGMGDTLRKGALALGTAAALGAGGYAIHKGNEEILSQSPQYQQLKANYSAALAAGDNAKAQEYKDRMEKHAFRLTNTDRPQGEVMGPDGLPKEVEKYASGMKEAAYDPAIDAPRFVVNPAVANKLLTQYDQLYQLRDPKYAQSGGVVMYSARPEVTQILQKMAQTNPQQVQALQPGASSVPAAPQAGAPSVPATPQPGAVQQEDDELSEIARLAGLDEVGRGEYIKQQDAKAEKSGKNKFNAFGQTFDTDEVNEEPNEGNLFTKGLEDDDVKIGDKIPGTNAIKTKDIGEDKIDVAGAPETTNKPRPKYSSIKSITTQGDDLHRQKSQYPKAANKGDNPMANENILSLEDRLLAEYESIKKAAR